MKSLNVEVHGHRGNPLVFLENSAAGILSALNLGADTVEIDVHITADKQVLLHHDPIINSKFYKYNGSAQGVNSPIINKLGWDEVKNYTYQGESGELLSICSLREALETFMKYPQWRSRRINIEIKSYTKMTYLSFPDFKDKDLYSDLSVLVSAILQSVESAKFPFENVIFQSFDQEILRRLSELRKQHQYKYQLSYLYLGKYMNFFHRLTKMISARLDDFFWVPFWQEAKDFIKKNEIDIFAPNFDLMSASVYSYQYKKTFLKAGSDEKIRVIVWTVNQEKKWRSAINDYNVQGIITDRPKDLIEYLKK